MDAEAYWWRKTLAVDLGLYLIAIFFFAYLPPSTLNYFELFIMVLAILALVGVASHASRKVTLPFEEWSYLATGVVGLTTFIIYETRAVAIIELPYFVKVTYGLFLLAGAASGYAAHVIDGGHKKDRSRDG